MASKNIYKSALQNLLAVINTDADGNYFIGQEATQIVDRCQVILDGKATDFKDIDLSLINPEYKTGYETGLAGEEENEDFDGGEFPDDDAPFWQGYEKGLKLYQKRTGKEHRNA